uniref:Uncharacterized protein n=1 Tax=Rhizophora mucronata TaxID=61149 RepID=A0A2P2J6E7_RHIMU
MFWGSIGFLSICFSGEFHWGFACFVCFFGLWLAYLESKELLPFFFCSPSMSLSTNLLVLLWACLKGF